MLQLDLSKAVATKIPEEERFSVPAEDEISKFLFGSASRRRRTEGAMLFVFLSILSLYAAKLVGFQLGWLMGASQSPIAQAIAPSIFGLLAVLGVGAKLSSALSKEHDNLTGWREKRREVWRAILAAAIVIVFCAYLPNGIASGASSRSMPYSDVAELIGESWETAGDETAAEICSFTAKAHAAGIPSQIYERFMVDVIRAILDRDGDDTAEKVSSAIVTMEAAFPKPEPNADEKPKPEPEPKEPANARGE